ncbi:hypothetical protein K0B96_01480 [Horticoccus luteus]|uniref:Lipoprotein LpqB-like beta-propeller protein n=1 Tax=Horticoccus luteus TaxID=2862869 RepID=A0A8F9TWF1_9BACT|nr:hypothetical protein [Horticoccus luteus]QYM79317.1 hypothetical protein K0B96_01480 [Horticoccus luteus]
MKRLLPFAAAFALVVALGLLAGCATPAGIASRQAEQRAIASIFGRAIEAEGGVSALLEVKSLTVDENIEFIAGPTHTLLSMHRWSDADGHFFSRTRVGDQKDATVLGFDGKVAWRRHPELGIGLMDLNEALGLSSIGNPRRTLALPSIYPGQRLLADASVDDKRCHVLALVPRNGATEKWYFDAATGHVLRVEVLGSPMAIALTVDFGDFRPVGPLTLPFLETRTGGTTMISRRQSAAVNQPLDFDPAPLTAQELADAAKINRILAHQIEAAGGAAALSRIHSRVTETTVEIPTSGVTNHLKVTQKDPNLILAEQDIPGIGRQAQGFDGTTAWSASEIEGYRVLDGAERQQLLGNANLRTALDLPAQAPLRRLLPPAEIDGRAVDVVALASLQAPLGTYYFDQENGRILRIEGTMIAGPRGTLPVRVDFSDFRTVDGVVLPFVVTTTNPAMRMFSTIQSVVNNAVEDDAIFRPRRDDD